jgi:tetratricopeptide (TPR) repeat protein
VKEFRYKAFISYSHEDEAWARWLQRALETYRVPRRLVGSRGEFGEIPARITPVFRDREDLSSASSLSDSVKNELAVAESLIVVCSPAAARSRWVNEEIRQFRSLQRESRVYALIVAGDPQSADPDQRCFPRALVRGDGGEEVEPLAADARKWADGRLLAKLKLVAGILGIRLDDLRRRDMQRRRRNRIITAAVTVAIVVLTSTLAITAITQRKAAEQRRASTEELLSYMLGTVENLNPVSGLDVLDEDQSPMVKLAVQEGFRSMADADLLQRALDWREQGMAARDGGDGVAAMAAFQRSLAALVTLYQRDRRNFEHLFELGQAEFWVGYVHWDNGDLDQAEEAFTRYGVITRRLITADPRSAENALELSYTLTNLGVIESARQNADPEKAIRLMQAALEYNQIAIVLEPENSLYHSEMSGLQAHLADAWLLTCNLGKAYQFRQENVGIARQMQIDPANPGEYKELLAYALSGSAGVQQLMGLNERALESYREAERLLGELMEEMPEVSKFRWERWVRQGRIGILLDALGQGDSGRAAVVSASASMAEEAMTEDVRPWQIIEQAKISMAEAAMARGPGQSEAAIERNHLAIQGLSGLLESNPEFSEARDHLASALFQYWQLHGAPPPQRLKEMTEDYSLAATPVRECFQAHLASQQAIMRGDKDAARVYTSYLLGKGFYEPGFITFCEEYGLCGAQ